MEPDRLGKHTNFYLIGIICLMLGLILFVFSFYVFPYLIFSWKYTVPDFVPELSGSLQLNYHLHSRSAGWLIFLAIFFPSIILFVIADILSNKIDSQIHKDNLSTNEGNKYVDSLKSEDTESKGLIFKIVMIIILVFIASQFFQWALSISPQ